MYKEYEFFDSEGKSLGKHIRGDIETARDCYEKINEAFESGDISSSRYSSYREVLSRESVCDSFSDENLDRIFDYHFDKNTDGLKRLIEDVARGRRVLGRSLVNDKLKVD